MRVHEEVGSGLPPLALVSVGVPLVRLVKMRLGILDIHHMRRVVA